MITKEKIKNGLRHNSINLIDSPMGDGVVCKIGELWFYFGGETATSTTAKEYRENVPEDDIVSEIDGVLTDFLTENEDEYLYYDHFLNENLPKPNCPRGKYLLITTDGSSLDDYTFYDDLTDAQNMMAAGYASCIPNSWADDLKELSYRAEMDAILYTEETTYIFTIIPIMEDKDEESTFSNGIVGNQR